MRIRDWSSDVCSSDLGNAFLDEITMSRKLAGIGSVRGLVEGKGCTLSNCDVPIKTLGRAHEAANFDHPVEAAVSGKGEYTRSSLAHLTAASDCACISRVVRLVEAYFAVIDNISANAADLAGQSAIGETTGKTVGEGKRV